jgi:signal transduction histidine kinase
MRFSSISTRTMLILISVSVLLVLVLGGLWLYTTKQSIENDLYSSDIQDSRHMAESVKMYLDDISSNAEIVSADPYTLVALQANDSARIMQILENLKMSAPRPDAVLFVDNGGQVLYSTTAKHVQNIAAISWYGEMADTNGTYVTGLYKSNTLNDYAFAVLSPVRNGTTTVGRIMVVFTPENLQDSLKEHNLDPRDNIIVVDGNGNVISSNDLSAISLDTDLSAYSPVQQLIGGNAGEIEHADSWDGQSRISAYRPVSDGSWGVIVSTPLNVEYKQLNDLMGRIFGVLIISVAAVSLLGYFASRYLTDPIIDLSGTMNKVSGGDYDLRAKPGRSDEIGELAATFNSMMDKLEDARLQSQIYLDLMGHDINNMNQVALGYLQLADERIESGEKLKKDDEILIKKPIIALEESSLLIDNIRKLQRAKAGELATWKVDISALLTELKEKYAQVPGRDIHIKIVNAGKWEVFADDLIKDLFSNLIWNAIKHSDPDKSLIIGLTVKEKVDGGKHFLEIAVEDNGPGIPDEQKEKLFSRFARGKTKAKGSGLGLYLVRSLAESYHGTVHVEDRVKGDHTQGSRFVVTIPSAL